MLVQPQLFHGSQSAKRRKAERSVPVGQKKPLVPQNAAVVDQDCSHVFREGFNSLHPSLLLLLFDCPAGSESIRHRAYFGVEAHLCISVTDCTAQSKQQQCRLRQKLTYSKAVSS